MPALIDMRMVVGNEVMMLVFFLVFCAAASTQLFYYLWFYLAPVLYKGNYKSNSAKPPVSVIICARNEAENLRKFLPSVLGQDYPQYEVIIVNDCSEDNTDDVLGEFLGKYTRLKISTINKDPKFSHSKKFAQFIGIKAAENDLLLFTDADCVPESDKWIEMMVSNFSEGVDFVLGYGGYRSEKSLLNHYIRFDTLFIAIQYLGMAIRGIPYMGVGRNLAWLKPVFFRNKGFGTHSNIASGDDDLFVNSNASAATTRVEFRHDSHTLSVPPANTEAWVKQKQRHFTTARYYKLHHKILLSIEPFSRIVYYALFIFLLSSLYLWPWLIIVFCLRLLTQGIVFYQAGRALNETGLVLPSFIFDFFAPLINFSLYLSTFRNRAAKTAWK